MGTPMRAKMNAADHTVDSNPLGDDRQFRITSIDQKSLDYK